MAIPHTDDAPCGTAGRPCEDDKPSVKPASSDEARLTVVLAVVEASEVLPSKHFIGAQHVEAALVQSPIALGWVACDSHGITVATKNSLVKCDECGSYGLTPELSRPAAGYTNPVDAEKRARLERIVRLQQTTGAEHEDQRTSRNPQCKDGEAR